MKKSIILLTVVATACIVLISGCSAQQTKVNSKNSNSTQNITGTYVGLADSNSFEVTLDNKINGQNEIVIRIGDSVRNSFESLNLQTGDHIRFSFESIKGQQPILTDINIQ
ncbi:MAG: hypothetical protein Q8865_00900 [Bacillota bacterium]|nr:hypothetical protein [Bacillota bacterium]